MSFIRKYFAIILFLLFFLILVASRFYNLEKTARFIWDESSDLVRMRELYQHPKLTLIGPMSEDGVKVFGSLSYYMSLPFVVLFNFEPVSAVYATAFFGILAVFLALYVLGKQKIGLVVGSLLLLVSYPLLEAARWAWNPHFIPFWQALGLAAMVNSTALGIILSGIFFGLSVHNHYYAIFASIGVIAMLLMTSLRKAVLFSLGVLAALIPFVVFDLTHLPGLFITRLIYFSPISVEGGGFNLFSIWNNLLSLPMQFTTYLTGQNKLAGVLILVFSIVNLVFGFKKANTKWLWPVAIQVLGLSLIGGEIYNHYLLPAVMFFYLWILSDIKSGKVSNLLVTVLLVSNLLSLKGELTKNDWSTNIAAIKKITGIMANEYKSTGKKFNIAVLGSPDPNTKGRRYRDLLNLEDIPTELESSYTKSDVFFVSYLDWSDLKKDPSYEVNSFRDKVPSDSFLIQNSPWKVYLLKN